MNSKEKLFVVTVVFNPRGFKSRFNLYRKFAPYVEYSGATLITVEVAFNERPFEVTTPYNPHHLQLRTTAELWHKERALNLGIAHLLKHYPEAKKVAWIDADVKFSNDDWVKDTLLALDHYDVVQMYSEAQNLNPKHERMWSANSLFSNYINKVGFHQEPPIPLKYISGGHPGLAWAATIKALNHLGGLLDVCVHGSGDTHMANALMGDVSLYTSEYLAAGLMNTYKEWAAKCDKFIKKNIGYINGICFHFWHGKSVQRGYEKRIDLICFHQFDPATDLLVDDNGLYKWAGNKPEMEYDLRLTMISRNEDSIDE